MKVALVQDWLVTYRGGEKVLEAIAELFPDADLFTLIHRSGPFPKILEDRPIHTSFLQAIPGIHERYRYFLPLFPRAIESFDLTGYDLLLSTSHCVAKGVRKPEGAIHVSYVHAPMRYMWDLFDDYFGPGRAALPTRLAASALRTSLQRWDVQSAKRVDRFIANSRHIAAQVERLWGRQATVVHPPVELERFTREPLEGSGRGGFFLWAGAFAPYKRLDLALETFRYFEEPLYVVGSGQDERRARQSAPPNVKFLGQVSDAELAQLYRACRALLFTGEEDFGLTPLECQASGRPVIAYASGGALETVTPKTGLFFPSQTVEDLLAALRRFDTFEAGFSPEDARRNALRFSKDAFQAAYLEIVSAAVGSDIGVTPRAKVVGAGA